MYVYKEFMQYKVGVVGLFSYSVGKSAHTGENKETNRNDYLIRSCFGECKRIVLERFIFGVNKITNAAFS